MSTVWSEYSGWISTAETKLGTLLTTYQDCSERLLKYWVELRNNPTWEETSFTYPTFGAGSVMEKLNALESDLHWWVENVLSSALDVMDSWGGTIDWIGDVLEQTFEDLNHDYDEFKTWLLSLQTDWPSFSYTIKVEYLGEFIAARQSINDALTRMDEFLDNIKVFAYVADLWNDAPSDPDIDIKDDEGNTISLTGDDVWNWMMDQLVAGNMGWIAWLFNVLRDLLSTQPQVQYVFKIPQIMNQIAGIIPGIVNAISSLFTGMHTGVDYGATFIANFLDKSGSALTAAFNNLNYQTFVVTIPAAYTKGVSMGKPSAVSRSGFNDTCVWCYYTLTTQEKNTIITGWGSGTKDTLLQCPNCTNSLLDVTVIDIIVDWIGNVFKLIAVVLAVKGVGVVLKAYKIHRTRAYKKAVRGGVTTIQTEVGSGSGTSLHSKVDTIDVNVDDISTIIAVLNPDSGFIYQWILYLSDPRHFSPP